MREVVACAATWHVPCGDTVARNGFFKGPDGEMVELMQVLQGQF